MLLHAITIYMADNDIEANCRSSSDSTYWPEVLGYNRLSVFLMTEVDSDVFFFVYVITPLLNTVLR